MASMCIGATFYCIIVSQLKPDMGSSAAILAFLIAIIAGMIFSLLHSLATLIFRANQFLVSMVINYLGYGLAVVLAIIFYEHN